MTAPANPAASVILATYNQPEALARVLWGYAVQSRRDFELVVADDGSGAETAEVVERFRRESGMEVLHVWHEDRGFRKTEILNRAILASSGDYLIFSDGDCIPRDDFVAAHLQLAERGRFLSGGYLKLSEALNGTISLDDVRSGRATDLRWLQRQGWRPGRHALRLLRLAPAAALLDALTPTRPSWNGHNASTWRAAVFEANGFDLQMGYGGEDRAFGERLENLGVRGKQIRFRAPCVHLEHGRPYGDPDGIHRNREMRREIRHQRQTRARMGIEQLEPGRSP